VHTETGAYSRPIAVEIAAEAAEFRWASALHVRNPLFELARTSLADKDHESLRQSSTCGYLTAPPAQVGKQYSFGVVQVGAASQQEPAQSLRTWQYPANRWWWPRSTPTLHESSDRSLASTVAQRVKLIMEIGSDLAAFLPPSDQVRGEPIEPARPRT